MDSFKNLLLTMTIFPFSLGLAQSSGHARFSIIMLTEQW